MANRKNRAPAASQTAVGDDARIVPRTLRRRKAPGGINPSPTNLPKCPAKPDGCDHPGVRRAGCPHPAVPRGGANICGRIWNPPLRISFMLQAKPDGRNHLGDRRAGCPHPAGPRGGANTRGRIWNPPLRTTANGAANRENAAANPGNRGPALLQTPVGDNARIVPRTRGGANTRGRDKSRPYE